MTDLERIARAIWADRASRILAEDIAGKMEEGSAGKLTYDELGEKFRDGLMSEAKAAVIEIRQPTKEMLIASLKNTNVELFMENQLRYSEAVLQAMCDVILNSENAA